jgi:hypothetical protein
MVMRRQCTFLSPTGQPCRAAPLKDGQFCWVHSPDRQKEVQEARRLGGLRHKREVAIASAFQFDSVDSVKGIRRIVLIALLDTLAEENSIARNRALAYLAQVALHILEVGTLEERIIALEELAKEKNESGQKIKTN